MPHFDYITPSITPLSEIHEVKYLLQNQK